MFERILVPIDFGEPAARAIELAIVLAEKRDATLTILHVSSFPFASYGYGGDLYWPSDDLERAAQAALTDSVDLIKQRYAKTDSLLTSGNPWEQILAVAKEKRTELIVMGTHGRRGLPRMILGSVAEKVLRLSPVPVLTCRETRATAQPSHETSPRTEIRRILVATDFSPSSERALESALSLAKLHEAKLTVLHALESAHYSPAPFPYPLPIPVEPRETALKQINELVARAQTQWPSTDARLREGLPWQEIVAGAQEVSADLIVMGSQGLRGLPHWLLGSVAERVTRLSPVPVLTIRQ